jgi:hypothetical protein
MNRDQIAELIQTALDAYYDELDDPADVDTEDLGHVIARALVRANVINAA